MFRWHFWKYTLLYLLVNENAAACELVHSPAVFVMAGLVCGYARQ